MQIKMLKFYVTRMIGKKFQKIIISKLRGGTEKRELIQPDGNNKTFLDGNVVIF